MFIKEIVKYVRSESGVSEHPQQLSMSRADCMLPVDDNEMGGLVLVMQSNGGDFVEWVHSCLTTPITGNSADWIHDVSMQDCPERNESHTDARVFAYKAFLVSSVFAIKNLKLAAAGNTALTVLILPNYNKLPLIAQDDILKLFENLENSVTMGFMTRHTAPYSARSNSVSSASSGGSDQNLGSPLIKSPNGSPKKSIGSQGSFWVGCGSGTVKHSEQRGAASRQCCLCAVS